MRLAKDHTLLKSNMFSAKTHESESFYGRRIAINQKYLLNEQGILHVQTNEVRHTKAMEKLPSVRYPSAD